MNLKYAEFCKFSDVPSRTEGENTITPIHEFAATSDMPTPDNTGIRLIEVPPNGSIPLHAHDKGDKFVVICLKGSGKHWVDVNGQTVEEHEISSDGVSLHKCDIINDSAMHGYEAYGEGLTLLSIYNTEGVSDARLRSYHEA